MTKAITSAKKKPSEEFDKIYTSKIIQEAYLKTHPDLGPIKNVSEALKYYNLALTKEITTTQDKEAIVNSIRWSSSICWNRPGGSFWHPCPSKTYGAFHH